MNIHAYVVFLCKTAGVAAAAVLCLCAGAAHAETVSVTGNLFDYSSKGSDFLTPVQQMTIAANPLSTSQSAVDGANTASSTFSFTDAAFQINTSHARTNVMNAYAESAGTVTFSVQPSSGGALAYALSGTYSATDNTAAGTIYLTATLTDLTTNTVLFDNFQESLSTANQSFTLGQTAGDDYNQLTGSLTGNLVAGDDYLWQYDMLISHDTNGTIGNSTATGQLLLSFSETAGPGSIPGDGAPMPLAATSGLALIGTLGLLHRTMRKLA